MFVHDCYSSLQRRIYNHGPHPAIPLIFVVITDTKNYKDFEKYEWASHKNRLVTIIYIYIYYRTFNTAQIHYFF